MSGPKLVSGSLAWGDELHGEVRVWGFAEFDLPQTLPQPNNVNFLVAVDWEVWGAVGSALVVWGRGR